MPLSKHEQIEIIHSETQRVNDCPSSFPEAQKRVDVIAASNSDFIRLRMERMIGTNVFSHLSALEAMRQIHEGTAVPPVASAQEDYIKQTAEHDKKAAQTVLGELKSQDDHPFSAVYESFEKKLDASQEFMLRNPDIVRRSGKYPLVSKANTEHVFVNQFSGNALHMTMSLVVREAMKVALKRGALPEPEELGQTIKEEAVDELTGFSRVNSQVLSYYTDGREEAKRQYQAVLTKQISPVVEWSEIINDYINEGVLSVSVRSLALHLMQAENKVSKPKASGLCGGSLSLRPYENKTNRPNSKIAQEFFLDSGAPLNVSQFSAVHYQLVRGVTVAETTIFSDPTYREAMNEISKDVRADADSL